MMDLTEEDKRLVALALQGLCMRQGAPIFARVIALCEKMGIRSYLEEYLADWISYSSSSTRHPQQDETQDTPR